MVSLAILIIYSVARMIGGRDQETLEKYNIPFTNRLWKRIIAPSFLGLCLVLVSFFERTFSSVLLLYPLAEIGSAFCDGYGNDSGKAWREVVQRVLSAVASTLPAIVLVYDSHMFLILFAQLLLALTVKVTLNFVKVKAPIEETIINFFSAALKPFMV